MFQNKLHDQGIITKNKARLVVQGYNQEDEIDYDETFALLARMEAVISKAQAIPNKAH